jgi:NAD(P)-dependent dehydrogenase (short-subunit alcohol dehydrogenase family)
VDRAIEAMGGIDVAVNNAGFGVAGYMETVTDDQLRRLFEVNFFGVQRVIRTVVDPLRGGQGPMAINRTTDKIQAQLLESMEMQEMLSVKP